jgi:hypothetical protein
MENPKKEFLSVSITPDGLAHMRSLALTAKWLFITGTLSTLLYAGIETLRMIRIDADRYASNLPLFILMKYGGLFVILGALLSAIQLYMYLQFTTRSKKAIEELDSETFNQCFRYLRKMNQLAFFVIGINILMGLLQVWIQLEFLRGMGRTSG